jgi:hypothetical protein
MTRVLVHAGFHKTGTTSLQKYLSRHEAAFKPYFDFYGQTDFKKAAGRARIYAQKPFIWRRRRFQRAFDTFLRSVADAETIVLSRENFSGQMPGYRNWRGKPLTSYRRAAVPLCRDVVAGLRRRFGADVQIAFLFTTRDSEDWLRSAYGQLLRTTDLDTDLDGLRALLGRPVDLAAEAAHIARALRPVPVHMRALEDLSPRRAGPAAAVLDLMGVPEALADTLPPAERHYERVPPEIEAEFLALNRSGEDKDRVKFRKEQLIRRAGL